MASLYSNEAIIHFTDNLAGITTKVELYNYNRIYSDILEYTRLIPYCHL